MDPFQLFNAVAGPGQLFDVQEDKFLHHDLEFRKLLQFQILLLNLLLLLLQLPPLASLFRIALHDASHHEGATVLLLQLLKQLLIFHIICS